MIGLSKRNFKLCSIHAFCIALAISVCANGVITDLLLLRLEFDLAKFGIIKSCMYLLPAISYFAATGFLSRLNKDLDVAAQAYLWRVILPIILTAAALLTRSQNFLLILAVVIFSLSFSCAMFANNTLLKIYRNAFSPSDFNRGCVLLTALLGFPGTLFCLLAIAILNRFSDSRQSFLLCLLVIQLFTLLFEYPGIKALKAVRFPPRTSAAEKKAPKAHISDIFRCRPLLELLFLSTLRGMWTGAVATYFVVYLLRSWNIKPQWVVSLEFTLTVITFFLSRKIGKLADRFGYLRVIRFCLIGIIIAQSLWLTAPDFWPFLLLFCLCAHSGQGLLGLAGYSIENAWAAALAKAGQHELFIAARTLLLSLGSFLGCQLAGPLFTLLAGTETEKFISFFRWTLLLPVLMLIFTMKIKPMKPSRSK